MKTSIAPKTNHRAHKLSERCRDGSDAACQPWCLTYYQDKEAAKADKEALVPSATMKKWEDHYNKLLRGSNVGCQPYFAPPDALDLEGIKKRQYRKQTVYQDTVHRALEQQIRPSYDAPSEVKQEEVPIKRDTDECGGSSDIEWLRLMSLPSVEVAYRNFEAKRKKIAHQDEMGKSLTRLIPSKDEEASNVRDGMGKVLIDPDEKKREYITLAKVITSHDAEQMKCVEELWAALGPVLIELNNKAKRKALNKINKQVNESKRIQQRERCRLLRENHVEVKRFASAFSAELENKYSRALSQYKTALTRDYAYAIENLLQNCDAVNNFEIEWMKPESIEKFQKDIKTFTHDSNTWVKRIERVAEKKISNEQEHITGSQRIKCDVQEREEARILDSLAELKKDHDMIKSTLADYLCRRDQAVAHQKATIVGLQKKADIWKDLSRSLTDQFQKFITFTLDSQPFLTQYLLSEDEMHKRFLEDHIEAKREEYGNEMVKTSQECVRKEFQTCGSWGRLSRETLDANDLPIDNSSLDVTEADNPGTNGLSNLYIEYLKTGAFPLKPASFDELHYRREQETEAVVQTFGYEEPTNDTLSTVAITDPEPGVVEVTRSPVEDCAYLDDSTKKKVEIVLNLMHTRPELMKGFVCT